MTSAKTIPVLPCTSLEETLDFYRLLGFEVTHKQAAPYVYAAVRRSGYDLHFHGRKGLDPTQAFGACLVILDEVEALHQSFAEALRRQLGKVPVKGIPRISRMRKGQSRFTLTDPSGNSVIFIRRDEEDSSGRDAGSEREPRSRMAKALELAARLRDFKGDDAAAAKVLDVALSRNEPTSAEERALALAAREELALALGDDERARAVRAERQGLSLSGDTGGRGQT
ncbi:VOC family protein [Pyxidicoccus sp. 3LG]